MRARNSGQRMAVTQVEQDKRVIFNQIYEKYQHDKQLAEQMLLIPSQPPKYNFKRITEEANSQQSIEFHQVEKNKTTTRIVDDPALELTISQDVSIPNTTMSKMVVPHSKTPTEQTDSRLHKSGIQTVGNQVEGARSPISVAEQQESLHSAKAKTPERDLVKEPSEQSLVLDEDRIQI